jgi:trans-aconitate methyltransferase
VERSEDPAVEPSAFYTGLVARIYRYLRSEAPDPEPYARFITRSGEPALELGCGDGDPLLDLRARGFDVEGLDASADMLERCHRAAAERGLHVVLHCATFESMHLERRYRSIYLAGATFNLLPDDHAMELALARIAAHLQVGGSALIPLFVPALPELESIGEVRESIGEDGVVMQVTTVSVERDDARRLQTTLLRYELVDDERVEAIERPWVLHWVEQDRFRSMAEAAGLTVVRVFGPHGGPAHADDASYAFLLTRPPEPE